jgi:hypothetical protein
MTPEQRQTPPSGPITINLGFDQLIRRVDTNVTQDFMVITADKARLCLIQALDRMERRRAWIAPAGILATLIVVFPTTTFQDFLGLSKEYWKAIFSLATVSACAWLIFCLFRIRGSLTIEQIVDRLRTSSLAVPPQQLEERAEGDLVVVKALYGVGEHTVDVTNQLDKAISGGKLHVHVGNQLAGDPCRNTPKELVVSYRFKNREHTTTVKEGADLDLP